MQTVLLRPEIFYVTLPKIDVDFPRKKTGRNSALSSVIVSAKATLSYIGRHLRLFSTNV